jgi:hypothetical protein
MRLNERDVEKHEAERSNTKFKSYYNTHSVGTNICFVTNL